jgi:hypothetical protein
LFEITLFLATPGDGTDGLGLIVFAIPHPRHAIAGLLAHDPADIIEEFRFALRP